LGLGNVPFLAGELLYTGGTAGHNTPVNQLPGIVSNGHVVSANGLVVDPVDTQWSRTSAAILRSSSASATQGR
jgi:hypothetical protein